MIPSYKGWEIWQDPDVVACFANRRRTGVLGGDIHLETLLRLLYVVESRRTVDGRFTVLDLACGDGTLLETIQTAFTRVRAVGLNESRLQLEKARHRLSAGDVTLVQVDINAEDWMRSLPFDEYDAVVSSFALQRSEDAVKATLYRQVFGLLRLGGVFVNIEQVRSAGSIGERLYEEAWADNLTKVRQARGDDVQVETVLEEIRSREDRDEYRQVPVEEHLGWLRGIGYADVDCYWKHFELAVLAGYRPRVR